MILLVSALEDELSPNATVQQLFNLLHKTPKDLDIFISLPFSTTSRPPHRDTAHLLLAMAMRMTGRLLSDKKRPEEVYVA